MADKKFDVEKYLSEAGVIDTAHEEKSIENKTRKRRKNSDGNPEELSVFTLRLNREYAEKLNEIRYFLSKSSLFKEIPSKNEAVMYLIKKFKV